VIRATTAACGIAAAAALGGMAYATPAQAQTYAGCVAQAQAGGSGDISGLIDLCVTGACLTGQMTGPDCNKRHVASAPPGAGLPANCGNLPVTGDPNVVENCRRLTGHR
jgi:hypothetical protein